MGALHLPIRIGALASGGGSNLQALIDASDQGVLSAEVVCVISNNSVSGALQRARTHGIVTHHISSLTHPDAEDRDRAIADALAREGAELVALCGYMKRLAPETLERFSPYVLNIHPALLPKFGGKGMYGIHVHEAVLQAGETVTGATVHLVNREYDKGPILAQRKVPVRQDDTPETLQKRVLAVEHKLYAETIQALADGTIRIVDGIPTARLE